MTLPSGRTPHIPTLPPSALPSSLQCHVLFRSACRSRRLMLRTSFPVSKHGLIILEAVLVLLLTLFSAERKSVSYSESKALGVCGEFVSVLCSTSITINYWSSKCVYRPVAKFRNIMESQDVLQIPRHGAKGSWRLVFKISLFYPAQNHHTVLYCTRITKLSVVLVGCNFWQIWYFALRVVSGK